MYANEPVWIPTLWSSCHFSAEADGGVTMTTSAERPPISPGEPAPNFALPAVGRDGLVSLDDYRGRSPVLLAMFRGLYCPFCRRAIAQLGATTESLRALGV